MSSARGIIFMKEKIYFHEKNNYLREKKYFFSRK